MARPRPSAFALVAGLILIAGTVLGVWRFVAGLDATTNLTHTTPWGLWTSFKLVFVALAAVGYTVATAVYLFGLKAFAPLVRPAVLAGFLGYTLFVLTLILDLGRPWRILYPFFVQAGVTSALFEIAVCVALYALAQLAELSPVALERLGRPRLARAAHGLAAGFSAFGLLLSMLHQSSLGALYLTVPTKLQPLWYSAYLPLHFFLSSLVAGVAGAILLAWLLPRAYPRRLALSADALQGLATAGALALAAYLGAKAVDLALEAKLGAFVGLPAVAYAAELGLCGLVPLGLFAVGRRERRPGLIRAAAGLAVCGVVLNRFNVSLFMFNDTLPAGERYAPYWPEYGIALALVTLGVVAYRAAVRHLPILPPAAPPSGADRPA